MLEVAVQPLRQRFVDIYESLPWQRLLTNSVVCRGTSYMFFFFAQLYASFGQLYNDSISLCHSVVPLLNLCEHSDKNKVPDVMQTHSSTSQDLCLNTSKVFQWWAHLELLNARRTQVMDPHHCDEAKAPEDHLGLCRDPFMLAEAIGHLSHVLLCESKDFGLLEGSTRKRRDR